MLICTFGTDDSFSSIAEQFCNWTRAMLLWIIMQSEPEKHAKCLDCYNFVRIKKKEKFLCHPVTVVFDSSKQWQLHNSPRTAEPFARHLCACVGSAMWARVFVPKVWITAWLVTAWVIILLAAVDIDIEISFQAPPSPTPTPKTKTTPPPPPPQNLRSGIGQNKASYKLFLVPGSLPF